MSRGGCKKDKDVQSEGFDAVLGTGAFRSAVFPRAFFEEREYRADANKKNGFLYCRRLTFSVFRSMLSHLQTHFRAFHLKICPEMYGTPNQSVFMEEQS